jgi:outer membrane protein assembly factor BamD
LQDRARLLVLHQPDVVMAARDGEPSLSDPKPTLAPDVYRKVVNDFNSALNPHAAAATTATSTAPAATPATDSAPATATAPAAPAAPLQLQEVPTADAGTNTGSAVMTNVPAATSGSPGASGNSMGVEVLTPSATTTAPADNGGLKAVGPPDAKAAPPVEKAVGAPEQVNDIQPGTQPAAQAARADGKKTKPEFDKGDESSSTHKKKKGLAKLNPF